MISLTSTIASTLLNAEINIKNYFIRNVQPILLALNPISSLTLLGTQVQISIRKFMLRLGVCADQYSNILINEELFAAHSA